MKKGFTLIELLAVIIILSILMIVAVPNILETLDDAKKKTFIIEIQGMYDAASKQFTFNSLLGKTINCFHSEEEGHIIETINHKLMYKIDVNEKGEITSLYAFDPVTNFEYYNLDVNSPSDITEDKGTFSSGIITHNEELLGTCIVE